jgi:hypothetical protein
MDRTKDKRGRSRSRSKERHADKPSGRDRDRDRSRDRYADRDRDRDRHRTREGGSGRDREQPSRRRSASRSRSRSPKRRRRSHSRSRSRSPKRSHRRSRSRSKDRDYEKKKDRERKRSRSLSDSESDDSEYDRKRDNKVKRAKKKRTREEKEKRREEKREKKERKKQKKMASSHATSHWGKYGVIQESDIFTKAAEFHAWLIEERKINPETISKDQNKKEFSRFVEDFNTATLPHEKYYNMTVYERRMSALRSGDTLPPAEDSYDPNEDLRALQGAHKKKLQAASSSAMATNDNGGEMDSYITRERLMELRKVTRERAEVGRMKILGMDVGTTFGVRMDGNEFDE